LVSIYTDDINEVTNSRPQGIPSKIMSKDSSILNSKDCVNDHLLGATEIGKYIHDKFKKENYNIDWMVKNWLFVT